MSLGRAVSLGAAIITSTSGAATSAALEGFDPLGLIEGPKIKRDLGVLTPQNQVQTLSSSPLSSLFFSGKKAYQRQEGAYVVTTEAIGTGLEWSPKGDTLQVISLHKTKDGNKTVGYGQVNYYGRDEKRVTSHFKTPMVEISSPLEERKFKDHFTQAVLLSGNVGLVEFSSGGSGVVVKLDTKTGKTLGSWALNDGDQLLVDKFSSSIGERKAYIFHRELSEEKFKCALYDVLSGQKIVLRDNTGVIGLSPDGSVLLNQPADGENRKREKMVYKDGVLASYVPDEVPFIRKNEKPDIEFTLQGSRAYLTSNIPPERTSVPSKLDLGLAERGVISSIGTKNTSLTVALLSSGILAIKTINEVDPALAFKTYEDAVEIDSSQKRADVMADALDKISDTGADLSKLSDQQIKDLIRGSADMSSLGAGADLFKGQFEITREGSDVTLTFKTGSGHIFKIVPGGYEIIPPL